MHNMLRLGRPRINKILENLAKGKLIYIIAGGGFGKTQAMYSFLEERPMAVVRWIQLTESEHSPSYFWRRLLKSVQSDNVQLAERLAKLGFPKTLALFKQFTEILLHEEHKAHEIFLVFDDFHLAQDRRVLQFAERMAHMKLANLSVAIISRQEPPINAVSLFAKGRAGIITEDDLRFSDSEIGEFLSLHQIPYRHDDLSRFAMATAGWAMGVLFLSLALKRSATSSDHAINTMKTNIDKLFETEAFMGLPEDARKTLVKFSLVSDIPFAPLHGIKSVGEFLESHHEIKSFVWLDSLSGDFHIHPLYLSFLQGKHCLLTDKEKALAYGEAADWCCKNGYEMDAVRYYAKALNYERILQLMFANPPKMPQDTCEFYLGILEHLPEDLQSPYYLIITAYFYPMLLMGSGRYEEARLRTLLSVSRWEAENSNLAHFILYLCYGSLAYIDMFLCTISHTYEAPAHIKKSMEHLRLSNIPVSENGSFTVPDIRSYACLVGVGADFRKFDQFLDAAKETVALIQGTPHGMYIGYDELVACEIHYYKNEISKAKQHAYEAIKTSREKNQSSIETLAKKYLLRIAIHAGDTGLALDVVSQLRNKDNPSFWNQSLLTDLIMGSFYALIGCPKLSPSWLFLTKKEAKSEIHIPVAELAVTLMNYIALKKYDRVLALLANSHPRKPTDRFLFGELHLSLISSVAKTYTGDAQGGIRDFAQAYALSNEGKFVMFFVEMGRSLHPVINAVMKDGSTGIPEKWLGMIYRKAAIFSKKAAIIAQAAVSAEAVQKDAILSEREKEVLHDLYQGLSRDEIAENRYLSINTVKKILQSIFIKLDASNSVDAIRIAVRMGLVE